MYNKNDPLVNSVKAVMEQNQLHRRVEAKLCEELGIYSRKQLTHENQANYDALLEQRIQEATDPSKYSEKQKKLAAVGNKAGIGGDPRKIDAPDLAGARKGHASHIEEEQLDERNTENKAKKDAYVRSVGAKSEKHNPYKFKKSVSDLMQGRKEIKQMKEEDKSSSDPDMAAPADPRAPKYKDEIKYKEEPKSEMPKNPPMPPKRPANLEETSHMKKHDKEMDEANLAGPETGPRRTAGSNQPINEKAPPEPKLERMIDHIKANYSKNGKLTKKEKSIAYATAWKAKNKEDKS